jgi:hypothetical protein
MVIFRLSFEELIGAGAVISNFSDKKSPEVPGNSILIRGFFRKSDKNS